MAFLPPAVASQETIATYLIVGVVGVIAPLPNCQVVKNIICILHHVAFSSTSFLFFLRVRAVFLYEKNIVACFFVLWLGVVGGSISVTTAGRVVHLEPTQHCEEAALKPSAIAAPIMLAVNDTFVFLAISWRLLSGFRLRRKKNLLGMLLGNYLSNLSRALLRDGQFYYLVSVTSNVINAVVNCTHAVPIAYRLVLTIFNVVLTNIMACHVFRHIKFGDFSGIMTRALWIPSEIERAEIEGGAAPV
ncbi:hypothetical protein H0H81_005237 [Sphagnurus paluster]|uniref:Uncharacterized protein n=1 Tax=Sphagnurus paluster TaxID=117069 RepID=A0A9P7GS06_9AGAR|nr:hypothetical protein H0H81_005237 [Sphagnurus paluster]